MRSAQHLRTRTILLCLRFGLGFSACHYLPATAARRRRSTCTFCRYLRCRHLPAWVDSALCACVLRRISGFPAPFVRSFSFYFLVSVRHRRCLRRRFTVLRLPAHLTAVMPVHLPPACRYRHTACLLPFWTPVHRTGLPLPHELDTTCLPAAVLHRFWIH